jgi:hypothetical protein
VVLLRCQLYPEACAKGARLFPSHATVISVQSWDTSCLIFPCKIPANLPGPSAAQIAALATGATQQDGRLVDKILTSRSTLEGECKQVTVLFVDLQGSMELLADRDPEEARQALDPVRERRMAGAPPPRRP